jgi:hypothetical protein
MEIHSIKTKISNDGTVLLTELPFASGEPVEIIVKSYEDKQKYIKEIEYVDEFEMEEINSDKALQRCLRIAYKDAEARNGCMVK